MPKRKNTFSNSVIPKRCGPWRRSPSSSSILTSASSPQSPAPEAPIGPWLCGTQPDFRKWLLLRYANTDLSAKDTCLGAWHLGSSSASQHHVFDLVRSPDAQSGSYAKHLHEAIGLNDAMNNFVFMAKIPQQCGKRRKWLPHPFLLPHRQIHEFAGVTENADDAMSIPINSEIIKKEGDLLLCRLYVDGVDTGGKSRKIPAKVYCYMWYPVGCSNKLASRRLIVYVACYT